MQEKGKGGLGVPRKVNGKWVYPCRSAKLYETPNGCIFSYWNERRIITAHFIPDATPSAYYHDRPATGLFLCNWRQFDTVDGEELYQAIRASVPGDAAELYEYINRTVCFNYVCESYEADSLPLGVNKEFETRAKPFADVTTKRALQDRLRRKDTETVLVALAFINKGLSALRDKAGKRLECEVEPTDDESNEAAKMWIADALGRLFEKGCNESADTVYSLLSVLEKTASLYQDDDDAKSMVRTILHAVDANIYTWDALADDAEAERARMRTMISHYSEALGAEAEAEKAGE